MRHAFVHFLPIRPFRCARQPGALLVWRWKHRGHCARALARQDTSRVSRVIRGHMNNNTCYSACDVVRPAAAPCNAALACSWPAGQSTTRAQRSAAERAKRRPPASPDRISKIAPARAPRAGPRRRWWARRAGSRAARCGARTRRRRPRWRARRPRRAWPSWSPRRSACTRSPARAAPQRCRVLADLLY